MNVTATLFGQMLTFIIFVWFIKRFLWEPLTQAMDERSKKIADGLVSAELGQKKMEQAESDYNQIVSDAKKKASEIIDQAKHQHSSIVEEAREIAKKEADKVTLASNQQIQQEINAAKEKLKKDVAALSVECAEKIINKEIDEKKPKEIFDESLKRF
ncbi:MAG: F0F1 ATP synthase subunit B [Pseudomonadota bacterium]|nr:F0F1 ATP synthase subunit B [Pseudomonadota bacterium]